MRNGNWEQGNWNLEQGKEKMRKQGKKEKRKKRNEGKREKGKKGKGKWKLENRNWVIGTRNERTRSKFQTSTGSSLTSVSIFTSYSMYSS